MCASGVAWCAGLCEQCIDVLMNKVEWCVRVGLFIVVWCVFASGVGEGMLVSFELSVGSLREHPLLVYVVCVCLCGVLCIDKVWYSVV